MYRPVAVIGTPGRKYLGNVVDVVNEWLRASETRGTWSLCRRMYDFCLTFPYAAILALGGVGGYAAKGSTASLVAGLVSSGVLALCGHFSYSSYQQVIQKPLLHLPVSSGQRVWEPSGGRRSIPCLPNCMGIHWPLLGGPETAWLLVEWAAE